MGASRGFAKRIGDCWNRIGVFGDESCPELAEVHHCHNCFVYSSAGRVLLERRPPEGYRREWTRRAAEIPERGPSKTRAHMIFDLEDAKFALPVECLSEAAESGPIHSVPRAKSPYLLGLINIRGELLLAVDLKPLLNIVAAPRAAAKNGTDRVLVLECGESKWAAPVDGTGGIVRFAPGQWRAAPATAEKAPGALAAGIMHCSSGDVTVLDPGRLFQKLGESFT